MIKQHLKHSVVKTSLKDINLTEIQFDIKIKKQVGRQPEFFMFNQIDYEITDLTLSKLKENSNKALNLIELSKSIQTVISANANIKSIIDSFIGNVTKYNKVIFLNLFESNIDYDLFQYLTIEEIDTRILLEFFWLKEEFTLSYKYSKAYDKRANNLRTDYAFAIFTQAELDALSKLKGTIYNIYLFQLEVAKIIPDLRISLVKIHSYVFEGTSYIKNFKFPYLPNDFKMPDIAQLPFSYLDTQPRYPYPLLANSVILALTHRLPFQNNSYQQVEISTASCHTAYYWRKARWVYTLKKDILNSDLFLDLLQDSKIEIGEKGIKKITDLLKSSENSIVQFDKFKKQLKTSFEPIREIIVKIYNLERLYGQDKNDLIRTAFRILENDKYINIIKDSVFIERDKDIFGNDIPLYYIELPNGTLEYKNDLEKKDNYLETGFIVAKEMLDNRGNRKAIDIDSIRDLGVDSILNNDVDFPIKQGFNDINTPKVIYFPPIKNNFITKGTYCYDGKLYHNWMKRSRVLYIPGSWIERTREDDADVYKRHVIDQDSFLIPSGRELSGLPALAFSHILTPMDDEDKLVYFEKY